MQQVLEGDEEKNDDEASPGDRIENDTQDSDEDANSESIVSAVLISRKEPPMILNQFEPEHPLVERTFQKCTVQYGPSMVPNRILTSSTTSRIILYNLPLDVTPVDIEEIARPFGNVTNVICLEEGLEEDSAIIGVDFTSWAEARTAAIHLHNQTYDGRELHAELDTDIDIRVRIPLDSCVVKVAWQNPSPIAWASYTTIADAKAVRMKLNDYSFNDHKLSADFHPPQRNQRNSESFVQIRGFPMDADRETIVTLCGNAASVNIVKTSVTEFPNEVIRNMLEKYGKLEQLDIPHSASGPTSEAFARFGTSTLAIEAAQRLDNVVKDSFGKHPLAVSRSYFCQYMLPGCLLKPLLPGLSRLRKKFKDKSQIQYYTQSDPSKLCVYIQASIGNPKEFSDANTELVLFLQGELITIGDSAIWDDYFDTSSSLKALEKLNTDADFFIHCDPPSQTVRIFGDRASRELGKGSLLRLLKKVRALQHQLDLDRRSLRPLLDGALRALHSEHGSNKVILDVVNSKLLVQGDASVLQSVLANVPSKFDGTEPENTVDQHLVCEICLQKCISPVKLSCQHTYCTICLQYALQSAASPRFTPLSCMGQTTNQDGQTSPCQKYISYDVARTLLSMEELNKILECSYLAHIRANPTSFFFCPTLTCQGIHEFCETGLALICSTCSAEICCFCGTIYHIGLTCVEYASNGK